MSASNPKKGFGGKPWSKEIKWTSGRDQWEYYDKSAGQNGDHINVPGFAYVILEADTYKLLGSDNEHGLLFTNVVKDDWQLTLRATKAKGILHKGSYMDDADKRMFKSYGVDYNLCIFCAKLGADPKDDEVVLVTFKGRMLNEFIEMREAKGLKGTDLAFFLLEGSDEVAKTFPGKKKGDVISIGKFNIKTLKEETLNRVRERVIKLDELVQGYLKTDQEDVQDERDTTPASSNIPMKQDEAPEPEYVDENTGEVLDADDDDLPF